MSGGPLHDPFEIELHCSQCGPIGAELPKDRDHYNRVLDYWWNAAIAHAKNRPPTRTRNTEPSAGGCAPPRETPVVLTAASGPVHAVSLRFYEALPGTDQQLVHTLNVSFASHVERPCQSCGGSGKAPPEGLPDDSSSCVECKGRGSV